MARKSKVRHLMRRFVKPAESNGAAHGANVEALRQTIVGAIYEKAKGAMS